MKNLWLILLFVIVLFPLNIAAQPGTLPADIGRVKVENLTDAQIQDLLDRLEKTGMTESELEQMALVRGMQPSQVIELRKRINDFKAKRSFFEGQEATRGRMRTYTGDADSIIIQQRSIDRIDTDERLKDQDFFDFLFAEEPKITRIEDKIFGLNLFRNDKIFFQPGLNIPTPEDYQLGQGDEVVIDIWGVSEMTYTQIINPEGAIIIPGIGPVVLSGLKINEASEKLKRELTRIYSGLSGRSPNTFLNVSLGKVRSIKVNMVGEVFVPGTYTLPSLATVFNALYSAGGPTLNGSLRNVKVIRENKTIAVLDFYKFLLEGVLEENIRLQDQDVIFVDPFNERVEIRGEIKRPGLYEMKSAENLADLIRFSGGFTGKAFTSHIKIIRTTDRANMVLDVPKEKFYEFNFKNGDLVTIDSILNKFENRVEIIGAVFRPGVFELEDGMTLSKLIDKASGLREDAFPNRGAIYRLKENLTLEVLPFSKSDIDDESTVIKLKKEDLVMIPSIFDLREELTIEIAGEVRKPGRYPFVINSSVEDLIVQAGGLLESASMSKLEIARRVKNPNALESNNKIADIYQFPINQGLKIAPDAASFRLEPFDIVFVRRSPGYQTQKIMSVEGEVNFPGNYTLSEKSERISSLIKRSGGITPNAYLPGARLVRKLTNADLIRGELIKELAEISQDTILAQKERKTENTIGIDLQRILINPGSRHDLFVQEGDRLVIPRELQTVKLDGAILYSTSVRYDERFNFPRYIEQAGGFADNAKRKRSYIIYPNGTVNKTSSFLFVNNYPKVQPGSEIYVPFKSERKRLTPAETLSIFSATASMSLVIVSLINALK